MKSRFQAAFAIFALFILAGLLYIPSRWQILSTDLLGKPRNSSSVWFQQNVSFKNADLTESGSSLGKDVLTESDVLLDKPITDIKQTVSIKTSSIELFGRGAVFSVGDVVQLSITLRNGYNKTRTRGGDQLRVRIYNTSLRAYATGHVTDHNNGTYTAHARTFWPGDQTISVSLAYRRETVRALYFIRTKLPSLRNVVGVFKSGVDQNQTLCNPDSNWLKGYETVCNLTEENNGMPWFCGKPANFLCKDLYSVNLKEEVTKLPITDVEHKLFETKLEVFPDVRVKVKGIMAERDQLQQCYSYPPQLLWKRKETTGFFHKDIWYSEHCKGPAKSSYKMCLIDTSLIMIGDSTMRQWYTFIERDMKCVKTTEIWTKKKWHRMTACSLPSVRFTMKWIPHAQPCFMGERWIKSKQLLTSISRNMDETKRDMRVVFVINTYIHLVRYHHSIFRNRMMIISNSARILLQRNKNAKILIKGPHTYRTSMEVADYFGYLFRQIIYEEFSGLHDKVIYLDTKDTTIATAQTDIHPSEAVVRANVHQMLNYICK